MFFVVVQEEYFPLSNSEQQSFHSRTNYELSCRCAKKGKTPLGFDKGKEGKDKIPNAHE